MHPNRPIRNAQQVRALIQNMGRSIDEARSRRLGPAPQSPARQSDLDTRIGVSAPTQPASAHPTSPAASPAASPTEPRLAMPTLPPAAPPIRAASEMFSDSTPRLKARPKRAS